MSANQIPPVEAVEQYLQSKHDVLASTRDNHRYRLEHFTNWAKEAEVESMQELRGFHLEQYKNWRLNETECNLVTLEQSFHTLRVFLRWCEKTEIVAEDLSDKVIIPNVSSQDKARDVAISHDRATEIIDYLCRFHWASNEHIAFHTLYHCGMRRSGLFSLDVDDWHPEERYLSIRNRPDQGTRLKLGDNGERNVSVTDDRLVSALTDYIESERPNVEDDYGRTPLLASIHGRVHYQTITKYIYKVTRPCYYGNECPLSRDLDECEGTNYKGFSACPESVSPHPIRRSAISHHLSESVPAKICSERMSVSMEVLDLHYDARDEEEKRLNRERYLDDL